MALVDDCTVLMDGSNFDTVSAWGEARLLRRSSKFHRQHLHQTRSGTTGLLDEGIGQHQSAD
jgi:hypothetical protein